MTAKLLHFPRDAEPMDLKALIDKALDGYLPKISEGPRIIRKAMRYGVFPGGKRIRPIIVLEACRACGRKGSGAALRRAAKTGDRRKNKDALAAACALELVHAYSLIHDDLPSMDDDDFRRGKPSCHKKFGEANAILAGDALLTLAFNILAEGLEPKAAVRAIRELSEAAGARGMVGGQALDIAKHKNRATVNRLKTAKLFEAAAKIGAISAGASEKEIRAMAGYGINLGITFQLADDLADKEGPGISGASSARCEAGRSIRKARDALKMFGPAADRLRKIADLIWNA
jgi:geranylgeranyl diphosphate synthase type II